MTTEVDVLPESEVRALIADAEHLGWNSWVADGDTVFGSVILDVEADGELVYADDVDVDLIEPKDGVAYESQVNERMAHLAREDFADAVAFRATVRDPYQAEPALPFLHDEGPTRGTLTEITLLGRYIGSFVHRRR